MPSYKPRVQALLTEEVGKKFKILCKKEDRTESNMGGRIITEYIRKYEEEHGELTEEMTTEEEK